MKQVKLKNFGDEADFHYLFHIMREYMRREDFGSRPNGLVGALEYECRDGRTYYVYETETLTVVVRH